MVWIITEWKVVGGLTNETCGHLRDLEHVLERRDGETLLHNDENPYQ
jgi:hypothetical protein